MSNIEKLNSILLLQNEKGLKFDKGSTDNSGDDDSTNNEEEENKKNGSSMTGEPNDNNDGEESSKKKPKNGDNNQNNGAGGNDTEDDGYDLSQSRLISEVRSATNSDLVRTFKSDTPASHKDAIKALKSKFKKLKSMARSVKAEYTDNKMVTDISKAIFDLEDVLNDTTRTINYQDNGMCKAILMSFVPLANMGLNLLNYVPSKGNSEFFMAETRQLFNDISSTLIAIGTARTTTEKIAFMLNASTQFVTLFQTHPMIEGEVNFVQGANIVAPWEADGNVAPGAEAMDYTDIWRYYMFDADENDASGSAEKMRGMVGDNAVEPDITLTKPLHLLFVDDNLIEELRELGVTETLLTNTLGNYSIPTEFKIDKNGNTTNIDPADEDEFSATYEVRGNAQAGAIYTHEQMVASVPRHVRRDFSWSHNGTVGLISTTPTQYQGVNKQFIKDVDDLIKLALSHNICEINADVAFIITLTNWLNAALFALITANYNFGNTLKKPISLNFDRMQAKTPKDIILDILNDTPFQDAKVLKYDSIYDILTGSANDYYSRMLGKKFNYSEYAYKYIIERFVTQYYSYNTSNDLYLGNTLMNNRKMRVAIVPELYLPIDVTATPQSVCTKFLSTSYVPNNVTITNPFLFATAIPRAKSNIRRKTTETQLLANISLWHMIVSMTGQEWYSIINNFLCNTYFNTAANERSNLLPLFEYQPSEGNAEALTKTCWNKWRIRRFTPFAPSYNASATFGQVRSYSQLTGHSDSTDQDIPMYPWMPQDYKQVMSVQSSYAALGHDVISGWALGKYLAALINDHADSSYWDLGIVLSVLPANLDVHVTTSVELLNPSATAAQRTIPALAWSCSLAVSEDGHRLGHNDFDATDAIPYSTLIRRFNYLLDSIEYQTGIIGTFFNKNSITEPVSSYISTNDIIKAFRFVPYGSYTVGGVNYPYIVDNKFVTASEGERPILVSVGRHDGAPNTDPAQVLQFYKLIREDEKVNITETYVKDGLFNAESVRDGLLQFDDYHLAAQQANTVPQYNRCPADRVIMQYNPVLIPNTNYVAYRAYLSDPEIITIDIGNSSIIKNRLNDYTYVTDDFYCDRMLMSVDIPYNTHRIRSIYNEREVEYDPEDENYSGSFCNFRLFEIAINAVHRSGLDHADPTGSIAAMQALFGLDPTIMFTSYEGYNSLVRNRDRWYSLTNSATGHACVLGYGIYSENVNNTDYTLSLAGSTEAARVNSGINALFTFIPVDRDTRGQSYYSTFRYSRIATLPATFSVTGIPVLRTGDYTEHFSYPTAKSFYDKFGSIISTVYNNVLAYASLDKRLEVYAIPLGTTFYNVVPGSQLTVSYTVRSILKDILKVYNKDRITN